MTIENPDGRGPLENQELKDDNFDEIFDQAANTPEPGDSEVVKKDEEVIEDKPVEVDGKIVEPVKPIDEKPKEEKKPKEDEETYQQRYKTLQGIHKHDKDTWETEKSLLLKQVAEKEKIKEEPKNLSGIDEDDLTAEQKEALKEYEQDFDVVSKMEGLKRKRELTALEKKFESWKKEVLDQLKPTQDLLLETKEQNEIRSREDHFNAIRRAHEDFETYRDDGSIKKWIETKPKYLQESMMKTYSGGSAEDVIEFLHDFKKENNLTKPEADPKVVDINSIKAERKQALVAVTTRRGAVNQLQKVAEDFDGAFDEALNKG